MSQSFRQLLPASGQQAGEGASPASLAIQTNVDVPRRVSVPAACDPCRTRRSKCDGQRPKCAACINRNIDCEYETEPTETRTQALKRKVKELQEKLDAYEELYHFLGTRPDSEVSIVLQKIRTGVDVRNLRELVRSGEMLLQFAQPMDQPVKAEPSEPLGRGRGLSQPYPPGALPQIQPARSQSVGDRVSIAALLVREPSPPPP